MKLATKPLVACTLLLIAQSLVADDANESAIKAQKLVDRAITAMCGDKDINKTKYTIIKDQGNYFGGGDAQPYTGRYVYAQPDRFRMDIKGVFITVTDGDKGWMSFGGSVTDIEGEALDVARKGVLVGYATSLIPLQKPNKKFQIALAEPEEVDGEKCPGITVDHDGMPTLTIHFSKKTGLIKKTKFKNKDAATGFKEFIDESIFHEYKEFDGFQSPTKMTILHDGKKYVESNPHAVTYPKSIDESEFKKPE